MFLMRVLEAVMAGGLMVGALAVWRPCSASSSRSLRVLRWVVAVIAAFGVWGFYGAVALRVSLRAAVARDALANAASPLLEAAIVGGVIVLAGGWVLTLVRLGVPRFRTHSTWSLKYEAVALTVCVALLVTSLEFPFQARRLLPPEQRVALLDRSLRALEDGERVMPRDTWDPDYVIKMVGRDPQRLFRWVQQNTYWIPYHGVLRGPVGMLMDRQGNSLDRAILLATLLQKAGYIVRLAHGQLSREQVLDLLTRLEALRTAALGPRVINAKDLDDRLARGRYKNTAITNPSLERFSNVVAELRSRVADQSARLLKLVSRADPEQARERSLEEAMAALADHWWVQGRKGSQWVDLDLVNGRSGAAIVSAQVTYAIKDLPAELHHTATIRVMGEQWSAGKLTEHKILEQVLRPSDLYGRSVMLQFWPSEWIANDNVTSQHSRAGALAQEQWDAVLAIDNDVLQPGLLLANGDDPEAPVKGGSYGGIAGAFADSMGLNKKSDNRQLSAVWIDYEIHVPGKKPRTTRRVVFDLLGPAARTVASPQLVLDPSKRLTRTLALTMRTEMLLMAGGLSPQFVSALLTHNLLKNRDLLADQLKGTFPDTTADIEKLYERSAAPLSTLYALALTRGELSQKGQVFIDRPNILTRHLFAAPAAEAIATLDATDIVANEVGVGVSVADPFAARLEQGVLDTNAESLVLLGRGAVSAGDAFAVSRAWRTFASQQDAAALIKVNLPEDARSQIGNDLSAGYAVVAPEQVVAMDSVDFAGWWRIDPNTGHTLGMGENGWGSTIPEREAEESPKVAEMPRWKKAIRAFTVAFTVGMAFCVAPLIQKHSNAYADNKLHHSLGIWEGAIKPLAADSVHECVGDQILIAAATAWLAIVGTVNEPTPSGQSEPIEPNGPPQPTGGGGGKGGGGKGSGGSGPNEPTSGSNKPNQNPEQPPKDDPCKDATQPGEPPSQGSDQGPEGPPTRSETAQQLKDDVYATEQAAEDASKQFIKANSDMLQYRAQGQPIYNARGDIIGYEGPNFDAKVYDQLEKVADQKFQIDQEAWARAIKAERAWDDFVARQLQKKSPAGGACAGGGGARGGDTQPVGQGGGAGGPQPGVDPLGQTQTDGAPTINDPNAQWDGNTQPGGFEPPTPVNDPSGKTIPGLGDPNVPNDPSGRTQPGIGPPPANPVQPQTWDGNGCDWCQDAVPTFTDTSSQDLEKIHNMPGDGGGNPVVRGIADALSNAIDALKSGPVTGGPR